ncbi:MAG: hypothetical protein ACERKV_13445 [Clostridiaceae bacterium]
MLGNLIYLIKKCNIMIIVLKQKNLSGGGSMENRLTKLARTSG